jgi:tetratricopeptide (TPR) repeat protein
VGGILAMALYQQLSNRGIDAFYDVESIRSGQFDTIILGQIEARPYFLLVLSPGSLERCGDESDWLRREIEHAMSTGRTVIPCYTPNFEFDEFDRFLPGGLGSEVRRFNGQELPQRWFKYAVTELCDEFLLPVEVEPVVASGPAMAEVERIASKADAAPTVSHDVLLAQALFEEAYKLHEAGNLDAAIVKLTEAIEFNPEYVEAFNNRGVDRTARGDLDGAISDFDEAIRLDPDADAFYNRAIARTAKGDLDGAISDYDEAIRLKPDYAQAFYNRALARTAKGDLDGAISDYDEAIRLKPDYPEAFYNRALARTAKGDLDGAINDLQRGRELAPDDPDYSARLRELGVD